MSAPQPSRALTFGLMTYRAEPFADLAANWGWAEESGYDALYVGDHLWSNAASGPDSYPRYDCWVLVAALAHSTRRVRIGPYVSSMEHRPPAVVAKQAVTLDHLSGARLSLAVGAGGNPRDLDVTGSSPVASDVRANRFAEYVTVLRGLLENPQFTYEGMAYSARGAVRNPPPVQQPRPPLTIAAHIPASLRIAAQHADTWASYGISLSAQRAGRKPSREDALATTRRRSEQLDEYAVVAGRDPETIRRSFLVGFTDDVPFDSEDAFRDMIGRYAEIGIGEFVFPYPLREPVRQDLLDRISRDVMGDLRRTSRPTPAELDSVGGY